jgi:hypothetical protein
MLQCLLNFNTQTKHPLSSESTEAASQPARPRPLGQQSQIAQMAADQLIVADNLKAGRVHLPCIPKIFPLPPVTSNL